ncbi:MAG: type II toxin-antitoxin system VapC family toxin [Nitrococcus sp.]|nr:type II toxin-antitoxin system VapC family toxin [Nitrococcus sp.]
MLYLDTSALLPYYRQEASSDAVQLLLTAQQQPVLLSQLTQVEFASALARWLRTRELTEPQANRVESAFHEDVSEGRYQLRPVAPGAFERALHWLLTRKTTLRTLDALHLTCAEHGEAELVTLDHVLFQAAEFLGIQARLG